jgi:selenide,water dikinase
MNNSSLTPIVKHLVLLGGGHSHLAVLMRLGMKPVPGLAVTLITRDIDTPYSGALPSHISGFSAADDFHIDLRPLAQFAGARLIREEIEVIDLNEKLIRPKNRPAISFDILSMNIGSKPDAVKIPGASRFAIGIKPIDIFLQEWARVLKDAIATIRDKSKTYSIAIVGGGPASFEFALAAQFRIHEELNLQYGADSPLQIKLISADDGLLREHNRKARLAAKSKLETCHVQTFFNHRVVKFKKNSVLFEEQDSISADAIFFATGASIPQWPADCGLKCGEDGFIEVNNYLQSTSHPYVFVTGDAATISGHPRPKSGVYAVRQGKPLAENLVRFATARKLLIHSPQKRSLALISMGGRNAIASRSKLFFQGHWVWRLKNKIDNDFLQKYSQLPDMATPFQLTRGLVDKETETTLKQHAMRCAGCGGKVASSILNDMLQELPQVTSKDVVNPASRVEDAAMIQIDAGRVLLQTVDEIRAFINDPWLFAKIATNHCLSDIYAMGADPHSALAIIGLPFAEKNIAREQLNEIMQGCTEVLTDNSCALIGGHSAESPELSFGLVVNGFSAPEQLVNKIGMKNGDVLILTKPLGTGTLLAADMRYKARNSWMEPALEQMLVSSKTAAAIVAKHGVNACTDVTGFGLAGHLQEMLGMQEVLKAKQAEVQLSLDDVPVLDGTLECLERKIFSSLHQDNSQVASTIQNTEAYSNNPFYELLFDPQTAGGLLASLPEKCASDCLSELRKNGYPYAAAIGRVSSVNAETPTIILK